jgi:hypothetical protein
MIGWWPGYNFSVVARSLLIRTINLGLPWDYNELHVAKISLFATSALTAGKQPLYCMGGRPLRIGENASISSIQLCARGISDAVIQSSPCCGRTSSQFAEECHLPHASPARSQGTTGREPHMTRVRAFWSAERCFKIWTPPTWARMDRPVCRPFVSYISTSIPTSTTWAGGTPK